MTDRTPANAKAGSGSFCPICGKPSQPQFRLFCSKRCTDVDLNRWLSGVYVVPGRDEEGNEGDDRAPAAKPAGGDS